jgi:hypothetical protein
LLLQIGLNYSDKTNLVSIDGERGPLKIGYDFQHEVSSRPAVAAADNSLSLSSCPNRYDYPTIEIKVTP